MAVPTDEELRDVLARFVCVRLVQMHGVDLRRFAFDGSLTWAVFMMNADGTIYGRYGSRSGLGGRSDRDISVAGFVKALRGALSLHARYRDDPDGVGERLAGKTGSREPPWPTPEAIPTLRDNERLSRPFLAVAGEQSGCIHCHMVPANELRSLRNAGRAVEDRLLVPYPMPDALGLHMDPEEMATVLTVRPDTPAARAGLEAGDRIVAIDRQPILSTADIQWVLHDAGDEDALAVEVARGDVRSTHELELAAGWRMRLPDWRFINKGLLMQLIGFNVDPVPPRRARLIGLGDALALTVDRTARETRMATGLGNRDLIVAIDGRREPMTLAAFTAYVLRDKRPGDALEVTIMQLTDRLPRPEQTVRVTVR